MRLPSNLEVVGREFCVAGEKSGVGVGIGVAIDIKKHPISNAEYLSAEALAKADPISKSMSAEFRFFFSIHAFASRRLWSAVASAKGEVFAKVIGAGYWLLDPSRATGDFDHDHDNDLTDSLVNMSRESLESGATSPR